MFEMVWSRNHCFKEVILPSFKFWTIMEFLLSVIITMNMGTWLKIVLIPFHPNFRKKRYGPKENLEHQKIVVVTIEVGALINILEFIVVTSNLKVGEMELSGGDLNPESVKENVAPKSNALDGSKLVVPNESTKEPPGHETTLEGMSILDLAPLSNLSTVLNGTRKKSTYAFLKF
jgi:hypothetical protein